MDRRSFVRFALALSAVGIAVRSVAPASAQSALPTPVPGAKPRPPRLIVIDPGHGGHDPGAIGARGTYEKDVTLDIAKEMARQIASSAGMSVVLTRDTDEFLPLARRVERARSLNADLFVSIHADSAPDRKARGLSAYTLSNEATDGFAAALAQQENLADRFGVDTSGLDKNVQAMLADLAADVTKRSSVQAKQSLIKGAGRDLRLLDNPMRSADFAVLRAPDVPSILVETGFLSNREDEELLRDPRARRRIAGVLSRELGSVLRSAPFTG